MQPIVAVLPSQPLPKTGRINYFHLITSSYPREMPQTRKLRFRRRRRNRCFSVEVQLTGTPALDMNPCNAKSSGQTTTTLTCPEETQTFGPLIPFQLDTLPADNIFTECVNVTMLCEQFNPASSFEGSCPTPPPQTPIQYDNVHM